MKVLIPSEERCLRLSHFRRNTWKAVLLCAVLRLADTTLGLGLVEPVTPLSAVESAAGPTALEYNH